MMELIRSAYDWRIAKLRAIRHSKPPEPPMRLRLHEAGHAVVGHRFGYTQQGIMLREDDTGETSQQYATGMDDDMSVRLQVGMIVSMAGFAVTLEYPEYRTDARLDRYGFYTGEEIQRILDESVKELGR